MANNLRKTIMRRVYYSYAVGFLTESMLWQGFVLGACVALFGRLTHVAAIEHNFLNTSIQNTPSYVFHSFTNAFVHGEALTALVVLTMVTLSLSFLYRALPVLRAATIGHRTQTA